MAVRRYKDDNGPLLLWQRIENTESIEARHFDIEKYDIGPRFLDHAHGGRAIARFARNFDFLLVRGEQARQAVTGFAFIVNDERAAFQE